jgi:hypothetical protein
VQSIVKWRERGKYVYRELGKGLKLFLRSGIDCGVVNERRSRWKGERRERRRTICKVEKQVLKNIYAVIYERVYCERLVNKESNERNTFEGSRCCSDPCAKKTEEKGAVVLFISVKTNRELNEKLSDV